MKAPAAIRGVGAIRGVSARPTGDVAARTADASAGPRARWSFAATPLERPLRERLETRVGESLAGVWLHHGAAADRAAAAMGARAFTHGRHIVLGGGSDPAAPGTFPLLAHEAAHAAQQAAGAGGPVPKRTQAGDAAEREADAAALGLKRPGPHALAYAAAPPDFTAPSFKELWAAYEQARAAIQIPKALGLARQMADIDTPDFDALIDHGIELAAFLQQNGAPASASRVLGRVRDAYQIRFVMIDHKLPALGFATGGSDPDTLIALGEAAARAGRDAEATLDLGTAHELLSYYARDLSDARITTLQKDAEADAAIASASGSDKGRLQALHDAAELPRAFLRGKQYTDLGAIYGSMRRIYDVYAVLEREALAAQDSAKAAAARAKSEALHKALADTFSWDAPQPQGPIGEAVRGPVETAEVSYVDTPRGPGLRLYGTNKAETDLTQLPGLPSPKEVGNNVQVQNLGNLQQTLRLQTGLQAELAREPAIRAAFPKFPIDLNDTAQRQKAWGVMFGVYAAAGGNALGSLMALIGRYQKAYTIHTTYNVRDWGVSYLDSTMPIDLAGRVEKDCGVYALTVAWDVFQTAKHASPKLDLDFELFAMLEHVALVITDKAAGQFYVVNNDETAGPFTGDKLAQVAQIYQGVRRLAYTVGPTVPIGLGSTALTERGFHDQAWTRYKASADWGLAETPLAPAVAALAKTDPEAYDRAVLAARESRYKTFYDQQELLDRGLRGIDPAIDALAAEAGSAARLATALVPVVDQAVFLARGFTGLGPKQPISAGSSATRTLLPTSASYVFTMPPGHAVHPFARVARAVLHLQALGGTPPPNGLALVQFCDAVPLFHGQLDAYRAGGATGAF